MIPFAPERKGGRMEEVRERQAALEAEAEELRALAERLHALAAEGPPREARPASPFASRVMLRGIRGAAQRGAAVPEPRR